MKKWIIALSAAAVMVATVYGQGMPGNNACPVVAAGSAWTTSIGTGPHILGAMVGFRWVQDFGCQASPQGTGCMACQRVSLYRIEGKNRVSLWNPPWDRGKIVTCNTTKATHDSTCPPVGLMAGSYVLKSEFLSGGCSSTARVLEVSEHAFTVKPPIVYQ